MEAELWKLPCRVIYGGFCNFLLVMSVQVFVSAQNLLKITLHSNCHTSAPIMATQGAIWKIFNIAIFFSLVKMHYLIKCLVAALDKVEVKILVSKCLFDIFKTNKCWKFLVTEKESLKHLLGVTSEANNQFYHGE